MEHFEYKVVPAPRQGSRVKGVKGPAGRFANALESVINELAVTGWEYIRAESLPVDERQWLTMHKTESYQNGNINHHNNGQNGENEQKHQPTGLTTCLFLVFEEVH